MQHFTSPEDRKSAILALPEHRSAANSFFNSSEKGRRYHSVGQPYSLASSNSQVEFRYSIRAVAIQPAGSPANWESRSGGARKKPFLTFRGATSFTRGGERQRLLFIQDRLPLNPKESRYLIPWPIRGSLPPRPLP